MKKYLLAVPLALASMGSISDELGWRPTFTEDPERFTKAVQSMAENNAVLYNNVARPLTLTGQTLMTLDSCGIDFDSSEIKDIISHLRMNTIIPADALVGYGFVHSPKAFPCDDAAEYYKELIPQLEVMTDWAKQQDTLTTFPAGKK